MLSLSFRPGPGLPVRHWKTVSATEAAGWVQPGTTVAVGWLSDGLATALADGFLADGQPAALTIVYAQTSGDGRNHGLNLLAHKGLVRRVVGGQWYPVPGLQALATTNQIEAYSLPVGVINRFPRCRRGPAGASQPHRPGDLHRPAQRWRTAEPAHAGAIGAAGPPSRR